MTKEAQIKEGALRLAAAILDTTVTVQTASGFKLDGIGLHHPDGTVESIFSVRKPASDKLVDSELTRAELVALLRRAQAERDEMQARELMTDSALTRAQFKIEALEREAAAPAASEDTGPHVKDILRVSTVTWEGQAPQVVIVSSVMLSPEDLGPVLAAVRGSK